MSYVRKEELAEGVEVHTLRGVSVEQRVARHAVEENDAEEQQRRTKRAHHEVLQTGFER